MTVIALNHQNFDETIQNNDVVVVDFWAKWCGPCLAFEPIFAQISTHYADVVFAKVNIDEEMELAQDFQVKSIPFLMIFRREFAIFAEPGVQTATNLETLVREAKALDINLLRAQIPPGM